MTGLFAAIAALVPLTFFIVGYRIGLARYRSDRDELEAEWEIIDRLRNAHEEFFKVRHRRTVNQGLSRTDARISHTSHGEVERLEKEANLSVT